MKPPPGPDRIHIEAFVLALFKYATAGNWVSLRAFPDKGGGNRPFRITPHQLNGNLDALINLAYREVELAAHAREKVVFCPPVATFTNSKQATEAALAEGLVISNELDANPQAGLAKLKQLLGPQVCANEPKKIGAKLSLAQKHCNRRRKN
jgi:hypothetical protein